MDEDRSFDSSTGGGFEPTYPTRPSMSRSSSVSSFLGRQGLDRYGEDWGGGALTLIGELFSALLLDAADDIDVAETFFGMLRFRE
jgi:hypothetical protein